MEKTHTLNTLPESLELLPLRATELLELPISQSYVAAGFPSPAEDYLEDKINLQQVLIRNPTATYLVRVRGESMRDARLHDGDILVVDRSLKPSHGHIIIGVVDGEFTVKRLLQKGLRLYLQPANELYPPVEITEEMDFKPWGVVVWSLHKVNGGHD
ncbi:translesion error-prone DNA polymerase V autoproteolytic subunit [Pontibacter sp. FD36]|uniref:DNA polymerase V n=1 Tax=Pontibacter lucknowensis TaxID=1077936 RepID=A0A1N6WEW7_9BACT|nr:MULTISPECIES: translesion error-prone DNA polymerase V autoproteolytic subunit [Pontibacter]EJF07995.1 SOS mutagenesis protein UmuD [Pontibacter sp. BAB1700]MBF8965146.1 translesion error-prone DNA polymerase V autoproteolytic subunit [Pontibacter sp. FD36]SIQ88671.1 DNA polymerase V [Pontibacter lucknowensis]